MTTFMTALEISSLYDLWVVDFGATDHMTKQLKHLCDSCPMSYVVSVADGKGVPIKGKGNIKLAFDTIKFDVLMFPPSLFSCSMFAN